MKASSDPRHILRIKLVQDLFAYSFYPENKELREENKFSKIKGKAKEIDRLIEKAAPQFPLDKIAKIDVAILRLAIYELIFEKTEPPKVIIDEAIEVAHELGGESSSAFINGVLGTLYKDLRKDE